MREHPEVLECYTLMGDTDFLLRIVMRDIKAYEAFFLDHLSKMPGVESVHSSIALSTIKETTALPLSRRESEPIDRGSASKGSCFLDVPERLELERVAR